MEGFRAVGEFEKQESVLIIWPYAPIAVNNLSNDNVSSQVVETMIGEVDVIICCYDENVCQRAKEVLTARGIDTQDIKFVLFPTGIVYPRDFGADVMIDDKGNRARADFRFNTYGYETEEAQTSILLRGFSEFHAKSVGIHEVRHCKLISEGGDREFNGKGVLMAIEDTEVNKRNSDKTKEEVEVELKKVFSLKKIIWIPKCTYDDENSYIGAIPSKDGSFQSYRAASANGHIDEMCRFASADTILIASISEEEAQGSKLHALNKKRLDMAYTAVKNARDQEGKPFRILKLPVPEPIYVNIQEGDDAYHLWKEGHEAFGDKMLDGSPFPTGVINVLPAQSYCNFLVANQVVIGQKYYEEGMPDIIKEKDEEALKVLKEAFKGRRVIQINPLALNLYGGGIHCHTRNIPATTSRHPNE